MKKKARTNNQKASLPQPLIRQVQHKKGRKLSSQMSTTLPLTVEISTGRTKRVKKRPQIEKKEWQKTPTLVILEESLALPALQLFRFLRNDNGGL